MRERLRFLRDHASGVFNFTELCQHYRVSRTTGYKWLHRFEEEGIEGLEDRSRRPHSSPNQIEKARADILLQTKRRRPNLGPKKIKGLVELDRPFVTWPAASTIGELFKKHGLVKPRRKRRKPHHPVFQPVPLSAPNQIWTADFNGEFKTLDGVYCYPLTIADAFSRYLLAIDALPGTRHAPTRAVFDRVFTEFGLPDAIRTDNGTPFASQAIHRLSRLHVWWIKLGITPLLIDLASPHQNGSHERMHRSLKEETTFPPAEDAPGQQLFFDRFRHKFNEFRPHEALDQQRPASLYRPSHRPYPHQGPQLEYPARFEVRKVSKNGGIRCRSGWVNVSHILEGEFVGLEEVDFELWSVYFGPLLLGRFKEEDLQLHGAHAYNQPTL